MPIDGTPAQTTTFAWDERDRLTSVTDALGRVTRINYLARVLGCGVYDQPQSITDPAGRVTKYQYDNRERLTQIVNPAGGQTQFAYNARGDVTNLTDPDNNVSFFYWDANRRLTQEYRPSVATYAERKA